MVCGWLLALLSGGWHARASEPIVATPQHVTVGHGPQAAGYLGVDVRDIGEDELSALKLKEPVGAEIIRVDHDGPAGKMGLRERDVVVQLNGEAITGREHMRRLLRELSPGRLISLVVSREGQQMTLTATMADRSQVEKQAWEQHLLVPAPQAPANALPTGEVTDGSASGFAAAPATKYSKGFLGTILMSPSYTGAMLEVMGPQLSQFFGVQAKSGLLVRSVAENSPAAVAGMHAGDVVVRANARNVGSMGDWAKAIREAKGRPVLVVVMRDRQERTLTLKPDGKKRSALELPNKAVDQLQVARGTSL